MFHHFVEVLMKCHETNENDQMVLILTMHAIPNFYLLHGGGIVVITEYVFQLCLSIYMTNPTDPKNQDETGSVKWGTKAKTIKHRNKGRL